MTYQEQRYSDKNRERCQEKDKWYYEENIERLQK